MEEDSKIVTPKTRRAFVKTAAQVAVTAPAVAMLLSASTKSAGAAGIIYGTAFGDDGGIVSADDAFQDDTFVVPGDDTIVSDDGI